MKISKMHAIVLASLLFLVTVFASPVTVQAMEFTSTTSPSDFDGIVDITWTDGYLILGNKDYVSSSMSVSDYIPIDSGLNYYVYSSSATPQYVLYDADKNNVGTYGFKADYTGASYKFDDVSDNIESRGAKYIRLNPNTADKNGVGICYNSAPVPTPSPTPTPTPIPTVSDFAGKYGLTWVSNSIVDPDTGEFDTTLELGTRTLRYDIDNTLDYYVVHGLDESYSEYLTVYVSYYDTDGSYISSQETEWTWNGTEHVCALDIPDNASYMILNTADYSTEGVNNLDYISLYYTGTPSLPVPTTVPTPTVTPAPITPSTPAPRPVATPRPPESGSMWDGVVGVRSIEPIVYLDCIATYKYFYDEETGTIDYLSHGATYEGTSNVVINLDNLTEGTYLDGYVMKRITVRPSSAILGTYGYTDVSIEPVAMEGITVYSESVSREFGGAHVFDVYIRFDNYAVDSQWIDVPFNITYRTSVNSNLTESDANYDRNEITLAVSVSEDYTGWLWQYDSIADTYGSDGEIMNGINDIIARIQNGFDSVVSGIKTQTSNILLQLESWWYSMMGTFSTWHDNLMSAITDSTDKVTESIGQQTDDALHGYDSTVGSESADSFNSDLDNLGQTETEITDGALSNLNEYTIPEEGIAAYFGQYMGAFSLVMNMLQSIFDSSGNFNILISIGFVITITAMLVGLFRFYKR